MFELKWISIQKTKFYLLISVNLELLKICHLLFRGEFCDLYYSEASNISLFHGLKKPQEKAVEFFSMQTSTPD